MAKNSIEIVISAKDLLSRSLTQASAKLQKFGTTLSGIGRQLSIGLTLPLALLGGAAIKAAVSFESAFAGVKKTVNATEKEFAALSKGIREMTKRLPNTVEEISRVAEAAGQLGIATKDILSFSEVMIGLGTTTNVSATEAATSLARLANITRLPTTEFENLGSAIVDLGNNFATTEREIIDMALNLAPVAVQVGFTTQDILGFSTAMSSVGIQAELAGSALGRVVADIGSAVAGGGEDLRNFAKIAGVSAGEFAKAFEEDAAKATIQFVKGLDEINQAGGNVFAALEKVGFQNIRIRKTLLALGKANDLLTDAVDKSTEAFRENLALQEELDKRLATSGAQFQILANRVKLLAIDLGVALLPFLKTVLKTFEPMIQKVKILIEQFKGLSDQTQATIVKFTLLAGLLGPMAIAFGAIATAVGGAFSLVSVWGLAIAASATLIIRFVGLNKIIAIAIDVIEALALAWVFAWESIKETFTLGWVKQHITEPLRESTKFLKDQVIFVWKFWTETVKEAKTALDETFEGINSPQTNSALDNMREKFDEIRGSIEDGIGSLDNFINKVVNVNSAFAGGGFAVGAAPGAGGGIAGPSQQFQQVTGGGTVTPGGEIGGGGNIFEEVRISAEEIQELITRKNEEILATTDNLMEGLAAGWSNMVRNSQSSVSQMFDLTRNLFETFSEGAGSAFARAIVFGEDLRTSFLALFQNLAAMFIETLATLIIQETVFAGIRKLLNIEQAISGTAKNASLTFGAMFASVISALPFPANIAAAPGLAAAATATMVSGAAAIGAVSAFAEGGITNGPTLALVGDNPGGKEAIIPMKGGSIPISGGGGMSIGVINIMPNARLDETIANKSVTWWRNLAMAKIIPALSNLGGRGATTQQRFRGIQNG